MNYIRELFKLGGNQYPRILRRAASLTISAKQDAHRSELLGQDMLIIKDSIFKLLNTNSTILQKVSKYYFNQNGKNIRPLIVLLISKATNGITKPSSSFGSINKSPKTPDSLVLEDQDINQPILPTTSNIQFSSTIKESSLDEDILPNQRRLAEITELIHTASLLHDDVIDNATTRRGQPSGNEKYGNKMAILAGDFLLARACVGLARLRNVAVVELLATVISNLVEGEFMQLRNTPPQEFKKQLLPLGYELSEMEKSRQFEYYIEKTYLKTASLISLACEAATCLNNSSMEIRKAALSYGRNLGIGFQVISIV